MRVIDIEGKMIIEVFKGTGPEAFTIITFCLVISHKCTRQNKQKKKKINLIIQNESNILTTVLMVTLIDFLKNGKNANINPKESEVIFKST